MRGQPFNSQIALSSLMSQVRLYSRVPFLAASVFATLIASSFLGRAQDNRPNQLENEPNQDEKQCRDIPEVSIDKPWRVLHPRCESEYFLIYPEPDSHHVAHRPQSKLSFDHHHKPLPFNRGKARTVFEFVPYRKISLVFLALDVLENF